MFKLRCAPDAARFVRLQCCSIRDRPKQSFRPSRVRLINSREADVPNCLTNDSLPPGSGSVPCVRKYLTEELFKKKVEFRRTLQVGHMSRILYDGQSGTGNALVKSPGD